VGGVLRRICAVPGDTDDGLTGRQIAAVLRLIASELIESTGHGHVDFALPYLREHVAAAGLAP
jgi:hypothetical protein